MTEAMNNRPEFRIEPEIDLAAQRQAEHEAFERASGNHKTGFEITDADDADQKPGFVIDPLAQNSDALNPTNLPDFDLKGSGWIKCADGTWIQDKGGSIYVKGYPATPAQINEVEKLAVRKGWTSLAIWDEKGRIDPQMTQEFAKSGLPCVKHIAQVGSMYNAIEGGLEILKDKLTNEYLAANATAETEQAIRTAQAAASQSLKTPQPA